MTGEEISSLSAWADAVQRVARERKPSGRGAGLPMDSLDPCSGVRESVMDDEQLRALLSDIATNGEIIELSVKASPRARPDAIARLPELYLKLVQRRVFGAQVRYELSGAEWLDTLIATPDGLRLVRVAIPG